MANEIRHGSACKPVAIPTEANVDVDNIDRCQSFVVATSQPSEKLYELGRLSSMATDKQTFETTLTITQLEYGELDTLYTLAGQSSEPVGGLDLSDFDDARNDFVLPQKDYYGGTLESTLWLEKMALDSFEIGINAEERLVRTLNYSGNYCKIAAEGNKYLIFTTDDVGSGVAGSHDIVLNDPAPVEDPNHTGIYILKVVRIRSGVATTLVEGTDYTWVNGTTTLTITSALTSDHYRIWYTAASYGTAGTLEAANTTDDYYLGAENVTVTIDDGTHAAVELTRLTALTITANLNRTDEGAIGASDKIFRDVENYDVSIRLDGFVKNLSIQEALMLQAGQSWGLIDYTLFDEVTIRVQVFTDSTKTTFACGFKITGCTFSDDSPNYEANTNATTGVTLEADNLTMSETQSTITS